MSTPAIDALMPDLARHEGSFPFLYLDTAGLVTCGLGHMIPNLAWSLKIPWQPNDPATIANDFNVVAAMPKGRLPVFYEEATVCRLPAGWAEQDAEQRLENEYLPPLQALFSAGAFDSFPLPAQVALLDMAYNLGIGGLKEYVHMLAACAGGDWNKAAAECHRNGISQERNDWCAAKFKAAVAG